MKNEAIEIELTDDQVQLLKSIGYLYTSGEAFNVSYLPQYFRHKEGNLYQVYRAKDVVVEQPWDRHYEEMRDAIEYTFKNEYEGFLKEMTDKLERYKAAIVKVIEMNYKEAYERRSQYPPYLWGCVAILEEALKDPS